MNEDFSIVIAGGGIVGLSVAALLTEIDGLKVTVLDPAHDPILMFRTKSDFACRPLLPAPSIFYRPSALGKRLSDPGLARFAI